MNYDEGEQYQQRRRETVPNSVAMRVMTPRFSSAAVQKREAPRVSSNDPDAVAFVINSVVGRRCLIQ